MLPVPRAGDRDGAVTNGRDWRQLLAEAKGADQSERICALCVDQLGFTGAGLSVVTASGGHGVVHVTDPGSRQIEELQFTLGEGPCVEAVSTGAPVLISDIGDLAAGAGHWPAFADGARAAGVAAIFAFPLTIGAIRLGALDLYRNVAGDLGTDELAGALFAATAAAMAMLHLDVGDPSAHEGLLSANEIHVHQATGMVKVQLDSSAEEALLRIRGHAFGTGRTLSEVARDVVERRLHFSRSET